MIRNMAILIVAAMALPSLARQTLEFRVLHSDIHQVR